MGNDFAKNFTFSKVELFEIEKKSTKSSLPNLRE